MNKLVTALVAALLVVSVVAGKLWLDLRDMGTQNKELQAQVTELKSSRLAATMMPRLPMPAPDATSAPVVAGQPNAPVAPGRPVNREAAQRAGGAMRDMVQQTLASPEGQQMVQGILRAMLPQQYPDLGKALNLTPAEEQKLYDLLARQQADAAQGTIGQMAGGRGDPAAMQEMQRKNQERQKANDAELAAMLGSKYPQYQEYQGTLATRQQVNRLQTSLGTGSNALSDAQSKSLISALAAEQARIDQATRNSATSGNQQTAEERQQRATENNNRLISVASSQLNPQQLESYKRQLEQEQNVGRLLGGRQRLQGNGGGMGGIPPVAPR